MSILMMKQVIYCITGITKPTKGKDKMNSMSHIGPYDEQTYLRLGAFNPDYGLIRINMNTNIYCWNLYAANF